MIYSKFVTSEAHQEAESNDISASVAASGGGWGVDASMKVSMELNRASSQEQSSEVGGQSIIVMGGTPSGNAESEEGFAAWADSVSDNPMPIQYKLVPFGALKDIIAAGRGTGCNNIEGEPVQRRMHCRPPPKPHAFKVAPTNRTLTNSHMRCAGGEAALFDEAYRWYYDSFAAAGVQEAFYDDNTNLLTLGGGTCVEDQEFGPAGNHPRPHFTMKLNGNTLVNGGQRWYEKDNSFLEKVRCHREEGRRARGTIHLR